MEGKGGLQEYRMFSVSFSGRVTEESEMTTALLSLGVFSEKGFLYDLISVKRAMSRACKEAKKLGWALLAL